MILIKIIFHVLKNVILRQEIENADKDLEMCIKSLEIAIFI